MEQKDYDNMAKDYSYAINHLMDASHHLFEAGSCLKSIKDPTAMAFAIVLRHASDMIDKIQEDVKDAMESFEANDPSKALFSGDKTYDVYLKYSITGTPILQVDADSEEQARERVRRYFESMEGISPDMMNELTLKEVIG